MGNDREVIYSELRKRMEKVGFVFEREQKPHFQGKRDKELKFVHPMLDKKFAQAKETNRAKKFYLKPLSDDENCEIGITTGSSSPLFQLTAFPAPNAVDTYKNDKLNAWTNRGNDLSLDHLLHAIEHYLAFSLEEWNENFNDEVIRSLSITSNERRKRLESAEKLPKQVMVNTLVYKRNPDVVAEALIRANGYCERCNQSAPFTRKKDNSPYLEVHHIVPLSLAGEDILGNVIALCPNCHREKHFG
ncbi:HNH endonuclease [Vibrio cholerae]|uniref:HNH endonuclease n=1 Tax=Vibrio cholerae TaxID=666 RepID=UPI002934DE17|nr:HNH endonuclease signature motif containing protein [Vibrio cholerae]EHY9847421.1 HNH endonuclease [Vibrio cholerae]EJL6539179.1 HNH endonuclease [Vibrio cholerae]EKF6289626.1 HNH endonuclease [Vibrio cholerae]MDV2391162.1 HNH endonuclease signature motif containing protein [Vibrio cholerae]